MADTTFTTFAEGTSTYVANGHATFLISISTDLTTASSVAYTTEYNSISVPTLTLYTAPVVTSDVHVTSLPIGATPILTPVTTTSVATTSVATTSAATTSAATISAATTSVATSPTTLATSNSTSGPLNGTTTSSGATRPTATHKAATQKDTGAIVGAAIGCLIGGALIAGLLTWLIMSSRQKKKHRSSGGFSSERHRSSRTNNEKALPSAPLLGGGAVGNWEKHLDQPESDNTIARSVKGLFDHIEVHVENYYRDAQVKITPELQNALMKVEGSNDLPDSVAGLLPNAQRPTMLIKHCIAHSIIEHIDSESDISDSFLPTDFIALPQALRTRRTTANKPAYDQAYARWRVLSAYLRPKPAEDPNYTNTRDGFIAALADRLCRVFDPWAMSPNNFGSRRENLINIMKGGSETGVMLFSQPSTFQWVWRSSSAGAGKGGSLKVVILPGLVKVRDEEARELDRGVELLRPVVGPITG